jgi:[acyl-carrier-protein] S-malonyltransferase
VEVIVDWSKTAFVFPGQGSQAVGMGQDVVEAYPVAKQIVEQADRLLGIDLSKLMFEGPEDDLSDTAITQPAMYVCSMAMLLALRTEIPDAQPAFVAGHSLGEFTALSAVGALSFEDGVRVVRERGRLMQAAGEENPGGMAAILALDTAKVAQLVAEATGKTGQPVVIANDNCPGQVVISGDNQALEVAIALAKDYGARRALPLAVSVATHSPLMEPAKAEFTKIINEIQFNEPSVPVYANVSAKPITTVDEIRAELQAQLTSTVQWTQIIQAMIAAGIEAVVEIGSKDVLTGLLRRIDRDKMGISINNLATLQTFVQENH